MDEIKYKLNTNNAVLVVNAVEKLINLIKYKGNDVNKNTGMELEELKLLKEKCSSDESIVSLNACQGILSLVELGLLETAQTMSAMISILPTAKNHSAITSTISGLLLLDVKAKLTSNSTYTCPMSLKSPQHPFITLLDRNEDVHKDVLNQMQAICSHSDKSISDNSLELLRPVFLWVLCNPQLGKNPQWRINYCQLLLNLGEHPMQTNLLVESLCWQLNSDPKLGQIAYSIYSAVIEIAIFKKQIESVVPLILLLTRLATNLLEQGHDPRGCYNLIDHCFNFDTPALQCIVHCVIVLLADSIIISPALYLQDVFCLCHKLLTKFNCDKLAINILISSILQWLYYPSYLTTGALIIAKQIMDIKDTKLCEGHNMSHMLSLNDSKQFEYIKHSDGRVFLVCEMYQTWENIRDSTEKKDTWLDEVENCNNVRTKIEMINILFGIFLDNNQDEVIQNIALKSFRIIMKIVDDKKELSIRCLSIILYKIANIAIPNIHLECLRAIPLMANVKENIPVIISILKKFRTSKGIPDSLLVDLYARLVDAQARAYPFLQALLLQDKHSDRNDEINLVWEFEIAKASAVKKICETRAIIHGTEMVPILSSYLNKWSTNMEGATATCLALDALRLLWRQQIVAPAITWYAISPKILKDKKQQVHVSICQLLAEVPALRRQSPQYDKFISDAVRQLWSYVSDSADADVIIAAFTALAEFQLTDMTLRDIPQLYRRGLQLPASYCKTPADASRNPEDVLDYIPCEVWSNVFKLANHNALPGVRRLCSAFMHREISEYRSGVYGPDKVAHGEPTVMSYLPPHSVVRGVLEFARRQTLNSTYDCPDIVLVEVLLCMSTRYPAPLPPFDFSFLHDLLARGAHIASPCLLVAARQALLSHSAKTFITQYLTTFEVGCDKDDDIITLFEILPALCQTTPPNTLRTVIENCLSHACQNMKNIKRGDLNNAHVKDNLFVRMLNSMKVALCCKDIHEANHTLLSQIVENYLTQLDITDVAWPAYVEVCCSLGSDFLERMTSPTSWWETSGELIEKATSIRARLAADHGNPTPLVWLNEIIDAVIDMPSEHIYLLRHISPTLLGARAGELGTRDWMLQLMARTQVAHALESSSQLSLLLLCDVFILSAILLSGHHLLVCMDTDTLCVSRSVRLELFPNALRFLLEGSREWQDASVQVIEWLHHTRSSTRIPEKYRLAFYLALMSCRHGNHYRNKVWTKVLSVRPDMYTQ